MNRIFKIFSVLTLGVLFTACPKDDGPIVQARAHADVYAEDFVKIEDYLKSHYVLVTKDINGDVVDVVIDSTDTAHPTSIWDQTDYPLQNKIVKLYGVDFKVYFLKLDEKPDADSEGDKPCGVDKVLVSYKGWLLDGTQFDYAPNPVEFNLTSLIRGWEYIMPEFRGGYFEPSNGDGTLNPRNYGSGVMFLPSGLAYFNNGNINVPYYAPLVFTFNLYAVTYLDQDNDKILSKYEYAFDEDGKLIDQDADKVPDVYDFDDDNDGYLTKNEIKYTYTDNGVTYTNYYPFFGAAIDDPGTLFVDESKGIPDCANDYTTASRIRKHLDKNCH